MRPPSIGVTILLASVAAISLSAQALPPQALPPQALPPQARRGEATRIEMVDGREAVAAEVLVKFRQADPGADLSDIRAVADAAAIDPVGRAGVRRVRSRSMSAAALIARL